jgi:hypothetical protein
VSLFISLLYVERKIDRLQGKTLVSFVCNITSTASIAASKDSILSRRNNASLRNLPIFIDAESFNLSIDKHN